MAVAAHPELRKMKEPMGPHHGGMACWNKRGFLPAFFTNIFFSNTFSLY
jgi:hypothetical protein